MLGWCEEFAQASFLGELGIYRDEALRGDRGRAHVLVRRGSRGRDPSRAQTRVPANYLRLPAYATGAVNRCLRSDRSYRRRIGRISPICRIGHISRGTAHPALS
jgi:hypothetical protein